VAVDEAEHASAGGDEAAPDEPVIAEPVTDPDLPAVHAATVSEPPVSESTVSESTVPEPAGSESAGSESAGLESAGLEPAGSEPAVSEPAGLDLPEHDPASLDDPVLDHDGPWSEEDYRILTAKGIAHGDGRAELIDGTLVVGPGPTDVGEQTIAHTRKVLGDALPDGLRVVGPVALRMGTDCVLVADLVVMRAAGETDAAAEPMIDAEDVLMVVEIVGPEHGAVDRLFKPQVYARARLPYLLLVDHHAPFAAASMVISGRYHEYARATGAETLELEEPFRLRMPLGAS
jgi:Putative restriction endonuclease